jgi:hypothetical protein
MHSTILVLTGGVHLGQIKSTLDLILEKTKHLSLTEQEKATLKQEKFADEARRHILPFLSEQREIHALSQWIEQISKDAKEEALGICAKLFIESLSPFEGNERILAGVEKLFGREARARWESLLNRLRGEFTDLRQKALARAESRFRELLESEGVRGRAVIPCAERTPEWNKEEEKLLARFQEAVQEGLGSQFHQR